MFLLNTLKRIALARAGRIPDTETVDEAELSQFAIEARQLLTAPWPVRRFLERAGVTLHRADYYAEVPTVDEILAPHDASTGGFDAVLDEGLLDRVLERLIRAAAPFDPPVEGDVAAAGRFVWSNRPFSNCDAMALFAMLTILRPRRVVEVGSGVSTLVAREALADTGGEVLCVEPYPARYLKQAVPEGSLIARPVQTLSAEWFNDTLADGDVLFIDSTHTVKHGSDCIHLYLKILPALKRDVFVHVHDIYLPHALPLVCLRDLQIYWTEQYLLYAWLLDNPKTTVLYAGQHALATRREALNRLMYGRFPVEGTSFWFHLAGAGNKDYAARLGL